MSDLAARLRAVVEKRLAVARAATPGPWRMLMVGRLVMGDYETAMPRPNGIHIALNDPADVILACERDLAVLERHAVIDQRNWSVARGDFTEPACVHCELTSNDGDPLFRDWPCDEIRDLATRYRVEM